MFEYQISQWVMIPADIVNPVYAAEGTDRRRMLDKVKGHRGKITKRDVDYGNNPIYKVHYVINGVGKSITAFQEWLVPFKNQVMIMEED